MDLSSLRLPWNGKSGGIIAWCLACTTSAVAHDWHDLGSKLRPLLADKVSARRIADAGRALALEMFDRKSVDCYWRLLIEGAHRFLPQASVESEDEIPLADVLVTDSRNRFSVPFQVSPPLSRGKR